MKTVTVELTHKNALKLLEELEEMKIIKVMHKDSADKRKMSEKYAGKLSDEAAEKLLKHVEESRNEWERDF